jgi:CubicO group peptidase (beta-lactamase class C family)
VDEFSIEEFRRRFLAAEPSFPVGTQWEYSNTGYILLSLIAERASGTSLGGLLESQIFGPLQMRRTSYRASLVRLPGRAAGYDWQDGAWKSAPPVYSGYGNSGIETTAADMIRFARALHARQLLSPSSYRQMLAPAVLSTGDRVEFPFRDLKKTSYGLGWFLMDVCGQFVAAHGGTIAGFSSNLSWAPKTRVSVIVLSNGKSLPDRTGVVDKPAARALRTALGCAGT